MESVSTTFPHQGNQIKKQQLCPMLVESPASSSAVPSSSEEEPSGKMPQEVAKAAAVILRLTPEKKLVLQRELEKVDMDPLLVLKVRSNWQTPMALNVTTDDILDDIANWRSPNQRRDHCEGTNIAQRWIYHFRDTSEITACRAYILSRHPYCFGLTQQVSNVLGVIGPGRIFADAIIINKIAVGDDDFFEYPFFKMW